MIPAAESFNAVLSNLQRFIMTKASTLPDETIEHLLESANHASPVDRLVNSLEALYAVKSELGKEGRDLCGQMAQFVAVNGFHGMQERGQRINEAMNREGGYSAPAGMEWPAREDDPAPLERYVPEGSAGAQPAPEPAAPPAE